MQKETENVYVIDVEGVSYTEQNGKFVSFPWAFVCSFILSFTAGFFNNADLV